VNQNLPPNPPGQSGEYPADDRQGQSNNPYYSAQQAQEVPDLDASAPQLKNEDSQRINRKAIMFLGGIVLLLVLMTVLVVMRSGSDDEDNAAEKAPEEQVVIPELPVTPPEAGGAEPVPLEPQLAQEELPPLPEEQQVAAGPTGQGGGQRDAGPPQDTGPSLMQRRMGADQGGGSGFEEGGAGGAGPAGFTVGPDGELIRSQAAEPQAVKQAKRARFLNKPDTLLLRGTYIRCVLETRIITDYPGFASCIVTEPVYSVNGRHLLLPKGSKLSGQYSGTPSGPRMAIVWDRVTTPTGVDVELSSPGVDNLGSAGHPGHFNAHWASKLSSALLISLISDAFKYAGAKNGPSTVAVTSSGTIVEQPFESNTARTVEQLAQQALTQAAQRPPTVTINQGTVVNVYVADDVDFSPVVLRR
jgi:type IV secretion system protein VirB10